MELQETDAYVEIFFDEIMKFFFDNNAVAKEGNGWSRDDSILNFKRWFYFEF